jgi:hypothetical protein
MPARLSRALTTSVYAEFGANGPKLAPSSVCSE